MKQPKNKNKLTAAPKTNPRHACEPFKAAETHRTVSGVSGLFWKNSSKYVNKLSISLGNNEGALPTNYLKFLQLNLNLVATYNRVKTQCTNLIKIGARCNKD